MTFKRKKIKDAKLRTHMNRLELYLKVISIYQNDKVIGKVMCDSFKEKTIIANKELENYLNKKQK